MTSQAGQEKNTVHILPSISGVTWEKCFLKIHAQNVLEKVLPEPFIKNQN